MAVPVLINADGVAVDPSSSQTSTFLGTLGITNGDLIIIAAQCPGDTTINTPTGFTFLAATSTGSTTADNTMATFYKIASAETGTYTVTFSKSTHTSIIAGLVRGENPVTPIGPFSFDDFGGALMTFDAITTQTKDVLLLAFEAITSSVADAWQPPAGFTNIQSASGATFGLTIDTMSVATPGTYGPYTTSWTLQGASDTSSTQLIAVVSPQPSLVFPTTMRAMRPFLVR